MSRISNSDLPNVRIRTLTLHSVVSPDNCHFINNHPRCTSSLIWAILVVTLSTSFVMGVNIGGPNVYNSFIIPWTRGYPFPCQKDSDVARWVAHIWWNCNYQNVTLMNKTGYYYLPQVPSHQRVWQHLIDALHTICFTVGGAIGGLTGQYWYLFLTRRNAIVVSMILQLLASILMIITLMIYHGYTTDDPDQLMIDRALKNKSLAVNLLYTSRFLSGLSAGVCCVVSTIYLMDISPRPIRGKIITFHQLFVVIGVLIGQIVGIPWFLGQHNTWNWGMAWIGLFSLAGCFLLWTLPESPRWLIQEHERDKAAVALRILRQSNSIDAELDEIEREEVTIAGQNLSICAMFFSARFRWPILTSITLNAIQQLSGINTVFFYSSQTFSVIGFVKDKVYWGILSTGLINLIATSASLRLIDTFGRRPVVLYPLFTITIIMLLLCIFIEVSLSVVSLILTLVFISIFAIGLGPVPYVYPNEVFTINMRPAALSISLFVSWLCNTLVTACFPVLRSMLDGFVFLIFCICCSLAFALLFYQMPETKRKKLSEIEAYWL